MTIHEVACAKAIVKNHRVVFESLGERSGRYKYVCVDCGFQLNFYEGEWFGSVIDYDCKKKEDR